MAFRVGLRLEDWKIGLDPFYPGLRDVGGMKIADTSYVVLENTDGEYYAREIGADKPRLIRVFKVRADEA